MSLETLVLRRTNPVRVSVTTTSRGITRRSGTQIVCVPGHATDTRAKPTTSTDTVGPSTFATITRAGLSENAAARTIRNRTTASTTRRLLISRLSLAASVWTDTMRLTAISYIEPPKSDGNEVGVIGPD